MISSTLQEVLMPVSFGFLLCLMIFYWGQAALFSYTKYSKFTAVLFSFSFVSLTTLIILRWVDSGHFPLSNLYESLLFLSWSFLGIQLVAQFTLISAMPELAINSASPKRGQPEPAAVCSRVLRRAKQEQAVQGTFDAQLASFAGNRNVVPVKHLQAKPDFALREVSQRQLLHLLGVITSPMALLTYGFAFLNLPREMQKATALVPALQSNWLMMHVTIMILSYAALLCGSIFSMVFLLLTNLNTSPTLLQTASKPAEFHLSSLSHKELPKLCFSDSLELHDWVQNAQTRAGRADGQLLDVALASEHSSGWVDGVLATRASGRVAPRDRRTQQLKSKASFTQRGPAQTQQYLALLNSKVRFAKSALTHLLGFTKPKQHLKKVELTNPGIGSIDSKGLETPYLSLAERLDNYSYRVLALGFPLLTVGILSGAVWANEAWGSYWSWDPKETWALITWLVFAIYLHARIVKGWTGQKPAIIATFGFFVVWFCYLGVNLLGTGLHSYGWFSN